MRSTAPEKPNAERILSENFAQVFRAYTEASNAVQAVIRDMCEVINSPETDADEREAAVETLIEALFPVSHNGELGIEIGDLRNVGVIESDVLKSKFEAFDEQDRTFAERLKCLMEQKEITQDELAKAVGVQQPAISMMLNRACHPQRRTVEKIADALGVSPEELWPTRL